MTQRKLHAKRVELIDLTNDEAKLVELLTEAESITAQAVNQLNYHNAEKALIKRKLQALRAARTAPGITDHAIVRYLERAKGMDMRQIRDDILSHIPENTVSGEVEHSGFCYVVRDRLLVTVRPKDLEIKE